MKKYYLQIESKQQGPYTLEEVKAKNINSETPVWHEGLSDWIKAADVDALMEYLRSKTPPPYIATSKIPKPNKKYKQESKTSFLGNLIVYIIIAVIAVSTTCLIIFSNSNNKPNNETNANVNRSKSEHVKKSQTSNENTKKTTDKQRSNNQTSVPKESNPYSNWSGTYHNNFGSVLIISGPSANGAVQFDLKQSNKKCLDQMTGTAYLTSSAVANYSEIDSECHLSFTFNPGQIEIQESGCLHAFGGACGAYAGVYTK